MILTVPTTSFFLNITVTVIKTGLDNLDLLEEMKQGQFSIFYGNKCKHGNKCNNTTATRVSLDFRVMPLSKYLLNLSKGSIGESAIAERKFEPGGYYYVYKAGDGILPRYCP